MQHACTLASQPACRSRLGAPRRSVSVSNLSQPFGTLEQERQQGMQLVSELKGLVVGMDPWLKACLRDSLYRISSLSDVRLANAKAGQVCSAHCLPHPQR